MKDYLKQQVEKVSGVLQQRSLIREYLQARILQTLQDNKVFMHWAFLGGTALRFLFRIPRYSEDLDFSLVTSKQKYDFEKIVVRVQRAFELENYTLKVKKLTDKTIQSAFLQFIGIYYEMGCSQQVQETLSIKIEIDTQPPEGAGTETTIIRRFVTVNINHYDKSSLLSGKVHALLTRKYTKGRDLYDLVWYLSDQAWPEPNILLLNNALSQTGWKGPIITANNWRSVLADRLTEINWRQVQPDLLPFLERQEDVSLVTYENCLKLLGK